MLRLILVLLAPTFVGCNRTDPEIVIRTSRAAVAKVSGLLPELFDPEILPSPGEDRLVGRVKQRLRLDRWLESVPLKVVRDADTIVVSGSLADPALRQRALDLAETTKGVEKVRGDFADEVDPRK